MHSHSRERLRIIGICLALWLILDGFLWKVTFASPVIKSPELYFLDVGQGDSELILLPSPEGKQPVSILIDSGSGGQVLKELGKVLPPQERTIDIALMTHAELDHNGGFASVMGDYKVRLFVGTGRTKDGPNYASLMQAVTAHHVPYLVIQEGNVIRYGDAQFKILSPSPKEFTAKANNDSGIAGMLSYHDFRALYTADIGPNVEARLVQDYDIAANVLKVTHHGSKFSSTQAFVDEIHPAVSIIEVGKKNTYGHPTVEALARLAKTSTQIFRTDQEGTMEVTQEGGKIVVHRVP